MATVLAFDTSAAACSAAVLKGSSLAAHEQAAMSRGHAEALMPMIQRVMTSAGVGFGDLDLIGVTAGPGSWTGLRIGIATARALALAAGVPALGVSSLAAVAEATDARSRTGRTLLVALESKRADLYVQAFDVALTALGDAAARPPEALAEMGVSGPVLVAGDGAARAAEALPDAVISDSPAIPDAAVVARLAVRDWRPGAELPPVEPVYLRPPDVTVQGTR